MSKKSTDICIRAAIALGSMELDGTGGCQMLLHRDTFNEIK